MVVFGISERAARQLLTDLARVGYVERDPLRAEPLRWRRTPAGDAVAAVRRGSSVSRAHADRLLAGVLRRVVMVNRNPYFLCRVAAGGVCGSYLTEVPVLDALGLAVRIVPKSPVPGSSAQVFRPDRCLPYWSLQKRLPPADWPQWRTRHVELYLVGGRRHLVLHRLAEALLRRERVRVVFLALSDDSPAEASDGYRPD